MNEELEKIIIDVLSDVWADGEQWGDQVACREMHGSPTSEQAHLRRENKAVENGLKKIKTYFEKEKNND